MEYNHVEHQELIPRLGGAQPGVAGPPWQIRRAMWPSRHPRGGSRSRHVASTFCAGELSGLSLAPVGVGVETSARLGTQTPQTVCTFKPTDKAA